MRKEDLVPSCSGIVTLSFSTLCLSISELYVSMGRAGKGYNSAGECHLDVVKVISSSLIIPRSNGSFSIYIEVQFELQYVYREDRTLNERILFFYHREGPWVLMFLCIHHIVLVILCLDRSNICFEKHVIFQFPEYIYIQILWYFWIVLILLNDVSSIHHPVF